MEFHATMFEVAQGASQVASAHERNLDRFAPVSKSTTMLVCIGGVGHIIYMVRCTMWTGEIS